MKKLFSSKKFLVSIGLNQTEVYIDSLFSLLDKLAPKTAFTLRI